MTSLSLNITIRRAESPSEKLFEDVLALYVALTAEDLAVHALCGNNPSLRPILMKAWLQDGLAIGELWTATEGDELVGFTLWTPPDAAARLPKEERAEITKPLLDALSEEGLQYYTKTYGQDFPGFVNECLEPLEHSTVWWLRSAMVRSDRQRRGIARALIAAVHEKVSAEGSYIACSTTTAINVEIYKKLGFELLGKRDMVSPWFVWPLWVLRLAPKSS